MVGLSATRTKVRRGCRRYLVISVATSGPRIPKLSALNDVADMSDEFVTRSAPKGATCHRSAAGMLRPHRDRNRLAVWTHWPPYAVLILRVRVRKEGERFVRLIPVDVQVPE